MRRSLLLLGPLVLAGASLAHAFDADDWLRTYQATGPIDARAVVGGRARVDAIDLEAAAITLVHEAVRSPDGSLVMADMPMTLPVSDPTLLHRFKVGERVRFRAARRGSFVTLIDLARSDAPEASEPFAGGGRPSP